MTTSPNVRHLANCAAQITKNSPDTTATHVWSQTNGILDQWYFGLMALWTNDWFPFSLPYQ